METQYFVHEGHSHKSVMKSLMEEINSFLKPGYEVVALSHTITIEDGNYSVTALLCYKER